MDAPAARLPRRFFARDVVRVARALLGQRLVRVHEGQRRAGIIVETEAYLGVRDKAAHTYGGRRTARNAAMWGEPGRAYVYFTYGVHHCLNAVAGQAGEPVAVLIRALEPTDGIALMQARRRTPKRPTRALPELCSGPGKLCEALEIDRALDGADLVDGRDLFIEQVRSRAFGAAQIVATPRVGIGYAEEWVERPLRFFLRDNPHVSRGDGRRQR